jgi:hypothetical protein
MGRSFWKFDFGREISDANSLRALSQYIKDQGGSLDCLNQIIWLRSLWSRHNVEFRNAKYCFNILHILKILSSFYIESQQFSVKHEKK